MLVGSSLEASSTDHLMEMIHQVGIPQQSQDSPGDQMASLSKVPFENLVQRQEERIHFNGGTVCRQMREVRVMNGKTHQPSSGHMVEQNSDPPLPSWLTIGCQKIVCRVQHHVRQDAPG